MELFSDKIGGVQAQGVKSHYRFELDTINGISRIFCADVGHNGQCYTRICKESALGYCKFEDNNDFIVHLNCERLEKGADDYEDFLLCLKAINFHELAHGFYAVRWPKNYKPRNGYDRQEVFKVLNMLMDQRDENFWLQAYPATERYLRFEALHPNLIRNGLKSDDVQGNASCFLLSWGRRFWLPDDYVNTLYESFASVHGEEALEKVTDIIDQFITTTDFKQQEYLVYQMIDVLREHELMPQEQVFSIEVDPDLLQELLENGGITSDNAVIIKISQEISEKSRNYAGSQEEMSQSDEDAEADAEGDEEEGAGEGAEEGAGGGDSEADNAKANSDQGADLEREREEMRQEAQRMAQNIRSTARGAGVEQSSQLGSPYAPSDFAIMLKKELEKIMQNARVDMGSHYVNRKKFGVLDVNRARLGERTDDDRIFRKFQPSKLSRFSTALTLLIDQSGSMNDFGNYGVANIYTATDLAWALSAALHNFEGDVEIIGFDINYSVIKNYNDTVEDWHIKADGGTDPTEALNVAVDNIKPLVRDGKNCMCIIITDGEWMRNGDDCDEAINKLHRMGVITAEFLIAPHEELMAHGCRYTFYVNHLLECGQYVKQIIDDMQKDIRRRLTRI